MFRRPVSFVKNTQHRYSFSFGNTMTQRPQHAAHTSQQLAANII